MLYSEKLRPFAAAHPCRTIDVDGAQFRYILTGKPEGRTLVFLNGGMNTLEMWMDYMDALADTGRVLLFDYPQQLRTNQALVAGMHAFFAALKGKILLILSDQDFFSEQIRITPAGGPPQRSARVLCWSRKENCFLGCERV